MRLLYHGPLWKGSTSIQRMESFASQPGVEVDSLDTGGGVGGASSLWRRIRWRLRLPVDTLNENHRLLERVSKHRPDVVFVDNSKVIQRDTLKALRAAGVRTLVYYTPDDIVARHNLSLPLKWSLRDWDILFTTKTFNVPELRELGVRRPVLIGKAYDPAMHHPLSPEAVGDEFERFDAVFVGTYERERCESINALAASGVSIVVYGSDKGGWHQRYLHPSIVLRRSVFAADYLIAWHTGKLALCFLRKINRDRITQRTMEIAAAARPMLAEKTDEHDQHFADGEEYFGFATNDDLVAKARRLLDDDALRMRTGAAGRARCIRDGYSSSHRAQEMLACMRQP